MQVKESAIEQDLVARLGEARLAPGVGRRHINTQDLAKAQSPEMRASLAALRRAGALARQTAIQTETNLVIVKDGKLVRISAEQLRRDAGDEKTA